MIIKTPGWPLGADISCAICGTVWTLDMGDAARIVVAPEAGTITVDAACPGCDTLYTATKSIGAHRSPDWMMAEQQSNVEEPPSQREIDLQNGRVLLGNPLATDSEALQAVRDQREVNDKTLTASKSK